MARRKSDGARVLVTCVHVVSAGHSDGPYGITGNEYIYQGSTNAFDKVGQLYTLNSLKSWTPVSYTKTNPGDFAALRVELNVTTDLGIHTHPTEHGHRYVPIVTGTKSPEQNLPLRMVGAVSGFGEVTVDFTGLEREVTASDGRNYDFGGVTILNISNHDGNPRNGDSGSPILWKDPDGNYRMCAIYFGSERRPRTDDPNYRVGLAYPAYAIEGILDIKFGVEAPTAKIATPAPVYPGQWFQLDGSRSSVNETGADPLKYLWEKVEVTAQPTPTQPVLPPIGPSTSQYHNFEAPTNLGTYSYKLTVTDGNGAKHSDRVSVTVVNRPTPAPTPTPNPRPPGNAAPPLPQEAPPTPSSSQWDVRYSNNKIQVKVTSLPTVNPAISEVRAYLEAGQPPNLTTVTEAIGTSLNSWVTVLSSSDTQWQTGSWAVHIRFENSVGNSAYSTGKSATVPTPVSPPRPRPTPEIWGPWTDTGVREEDDTDVPRIIWKEQQRTSNRGNTETRWVRA